VAKSQEPPVGLPFPVLVRLYTEQLLFDLYR